MCGGGYARRRFARPWERERYRSGLQIADAQQPARNRTLRP